MRRPRFRLWQLLIAAPIAGLLIVAAHDLIGMIRFDDDGDNDPGFFIVFIILITIPGGLFGLFALIVFNATRGDPPPR